MKVIHQLQDIECCNRPTRVGIYGAYSQKRDTFFIF